jgi:hypothetical protein
MRTQTECSHVRKIIIIAWRNLFSANVISVILEHFYLLLRFVMKGIQETSHLERA